MQLTVSNGIESMYALNPTLFAGFGGSGRFSSEMVIVED